ncbi:hypothetical protein [Mediannikoviicoccus vaginalis]|uniref:hypothetical protein n=1 Tax=Mediannikoviicoccus vaginalis TaxID=2899727 RepID=UPI001F24279D|nr:hypothetical protein [Mediannikoviicoccus vaginalis]
MANPTPKPFKLKNNSNIISKVASVKSKVETKGFAKKAKTSLKEFAFNGVFIKIPLEVSEANVRVFENKIKVNNKLEIDIRFFIHTS